MGEILFIGPLASLCTKFIEYKHLVGCKYSREMLSLRAFDRFSAEQFPHVDNLDKELVYAWTALQPYESNSNHQFRISVIRQFAKYLDSQGYRAFIYPPCYNSSGKKHIPYIFTVDEIQRIFFAADHMEPRDISPYRHITTPIIIKTLYGCGLRITETLNLRVRDVDVNSGSLIVLNTKHNKSRIVPMSDSLWQIYQNYLTKYRSNAAADDPLFPDQLTAHGFYCRFREILYHAKISHRGIGKGPRLHDMRHTFAVHCLNRWQRQGVDIYTMLPILSEYLGHASISATSNYLRLTPASFNEILSLTKTNHPLFGG